MRRRAHALTLLAGSLVLGLVPVVAAIAGQPFYLDLFRRIMIFAIAAASLDLILGFGGMVSFGHAAYLGIGAYAVAIPAFYGIHSGLVQWTLAVLVLAAGAAICPGDSANCTGRVLHSVFITPPDTTQSVVLTTAGGPAPDSLAVYHSVVLEPVAPPPKA